MRLAIILLTLHLSVLPLTANPDEDAIGHVPVLKSLDEKAASFVHIKGLMASLNADSKLVIYRGVPRPNLSPPPPPGSPAHKNQPPMTRFASQFFLDGTPVHKDGAKALRNLIQAPDAFTKFTGEKPCGGFHPNYALVWANRGGELEMHVCFDCREIKVFRGKTEVHCDIGKEAYGKLSKLLQGLAKKP